MRIWNFLNSRLAAALVAVAVLLIGAKVALNPFSKVFGRFKDNDLRRVQVLARLQLLSFSEVETPEGHAQRFVGRIRNNSNQLVTQVTGCVAFYDEANALKDVFTQRLETTSLLKPRQEAEFVIIRPHERDAGVKPLKTRAARTEFKFVDAHISHDD
jgi:hypothetical protein